MHIFLWSSALFLLNSWPLWAVEASDDPFPLFSLSAVSHTTTGNERPHQSTISSTHLLGGLPLCRSPSTTPSMIAFISLLSGIRHIWPTNCSFLCFIMSTTVKFLCTLSLMILLVILSFQHTFSIRQYVGLQPPPPWNRALQRIQNWGRSSSLFCWKKRSNGCASH